MRIFKIPALTTLAAFCVLAASTSCANAYPHANPQVSIGVNIGPAPVCPYGYYGYAPYNCAPYGYYGPEWFSSGVFVGAGPWFHGDRDFRGHVDNRFDPHHGYHGRYPDRGERADEHRGMSPQNFRGNEWRDGRGHSYRNGGDHDRDHDRH